MDNCPSCNLVIDRRLFPFAIRHKRCQQLREQAARNARYSSNTKLELAKRHKWRKENPCVVKANRKANKKNESRRRIELYWTTENREKNLKKLRENRGFYNACGARRKANKKRATPPWLTKSMWEEIKQIYKSCPKGYHVDHVIPLQGYIVCGLHVPWNLQYLTPEENIRKGANIEILSAWKASYGR